MVFQVIVPAPAWRILALLVRDACSGVAAVAIGKGVGKLRAQQEDLGRVVDPQEKYDQGACRAVGRGNVALAKVERDQNRPEMIAVEATKSKT